MERKTKEPADDYSRTGTPSTGSKSKTTKRIMIALGVALAIALIIGLNA